MRKRAIFAILVCVSMLCGCGALPGEFSYRTDTVVYIPVDPTESSEERRAEATQPTGQTAAAEAGALSSTVPAETKSSSQKSSSTKRYSGSSSKKTSQTASTEPSVTQPPATEAPAATAEPTAPQLYDISGYATGSLEYAVADAMNAARAEAGLSALTVDTRLCAIASARAYEASVSWSHTRPDGRWCSTVLADYGYAAGSCGENLAYATASSAQDIVDKWMGSDGTCANILGSYTTVGVGLYSAGGVTYVACLFV